MSGISISMLEIRQEKTSRFYLRVEWTSTIKGFYHLGYSRLLINTLGMKAGTGNTEELCLFSRPFTYGIKGACQEAGGGDE